MVSTSRNIYEIITIYRKMKKGRNQKIFKSLETMDLFEIENKYNLSDHRRSAEKSAQKSVESDGKKFKKFMNENVRTEYNYCDQQKFYDFQKYDFRQQQKFLFYSGGTGTRQFVGMDGFVGFFKNEFDVEECGEERRSVDSGRERDAVQIDGNGIGGDERKKMGDGEFTDGSDHESNHGSNHKPDSKAKENVKNKESGRESTDASDHESNNKPDSKSKENQKKEKNKFWLNIFDPSSADLNCLGDLFKIHDMTLADIKERNTRDKIEVFHNYTFISIRLFSSTDTSNNLNEKNTKSDDIDFNIILFSDKIITLHDSQWSGISDILNFTDLLVHYTTLHPEWVLFSILVEFLQDIRYLVDKITPKVFKMQNKICDSKNDMAYFNESGSNKQISRILKENFFLSNRLHSLKHSNRSKTLILSSLVLKHKKRIKKNVLKHIEYIHEDFIQLDKEIRDNRKSLERCQDLVLGLVNMAQSTESIDLNRLMKTFTLITLVFLPLQSVSGLWGMNVTVPYENCGTLWPFWMLTAIGPVLSCIYYFWMKKARNGS